MDDQTRNILLAGTIILGSFALSLQYTSLTVALQYTVLASVGAGIVYYGWKKGYTDLLMASIEQATGGLFQNQKDLEELWNDLQEWEGRDPHNTELIWDPATTSIKYSTPNPSKDFSFISIVTRYKLNGVEQLGYRLHVVIEGSTGFIVQHSPTVYKRELYDNPFSNVPVVQDLKRSVLTGEDVVDRLQRTSYGRLPAGAGYTPMTESMDYSKQVEGEVETSSE